ncbi:MAG: MG2 domain-containing protein, partial [Thermoguttaceae bacterium]
MTVNSKTRQQLLELIYGLLPQEEADELQRRIDADPQLAEAYARAKETSELLAEAAKVKVPRVKLKKPEKAMDTQADAPRPKAANAVNRHSSTPLRRGANWVVGVAAAILLLLSVGGYAYHHVQLDRIAEGHLRLVMTGPSKLQAGVDATYTISTTLINGDPAPAQIKFALYSPDKTHSLELNEATDESGQLQVTVGGDKVLSRSAGALPRNVILTVSARREDKLEKINTRLRVEPVGYSTQLSLDKPLYQPGETVYYRSLTLSRFPLDTGDRPMIVHFQILDPGGAVVAGSENAGVTERGVGNGAFELPPELAGGEYTLVARSLDELFPEQRRPFFVRRYRLPRLKKELEFTRDSYAPGDKVEADFLASRAEGGAAAEADLHIVASVDGENVLLRDVKADSSGAARIEFTLPDKIERGDGQLLVVVDDGGARETIAKTIPSNLGKVEVRFFPESGDLVAGLENRVYFTAKDPLGEPIHIKAIVVNDRGKAVTALETTHEGMGWFSFTPRAGGLYHIEISSPADVDKKNQPELPRVSSTGRIVLTTGSGVFAAGKPLEFYILSVADGTPLVVAASCRGVPVGQSALTTAEGSNRVAIEAGDEVSGVIRLTAYDYGSTPPRPIAERLVFRRGGRHLSVRTSGLDKRYSPGEKVELSLAVTDESGEPVPAALGVSVVDGALLSLADDHTPRMTTHFMLTTEIEKPEDLEDANFYLGDDR